MSIHDLPWYKYLEGKLEPSYPLMVGIAAALVAITVILVMQGDSVVLAGWLVYLLLP